MNYSSDIVRSETKLTRGGPPAWPDLADEISALGPFTVLSKGAGSTEGHCHTKARSSREHSGRSKVNRGLLQEVKMVKLSVVNKAGKEVIPGGLSVPGVRSVQLDNMR
jgi:hypothetical protein